VLCHDDVPVSFSLSAIGGHSGCSIGPMPCQCGDQYLDRAGQDHRVAINEDVGTAIDLRGIENDPVPATRLAALFPIVDCHAADFTPDRGGPVRGPVDD